MDETRLAEIEAQLDELACSDHGCVVSRPKGMGTNGGCSCVPRGIHPDQRVVLRKALTLRQQQADALVAEVRRLTAALDAVTAERDRLQRACDEGLPREYIECPKCGKQHLEWFRHDAPGIDGRKRPHHTHRCYGCGHVWDAGRWSFGADVPKPAPESAALATARREGAEEMRERCAVLTEEHAVDASDAAFPFIMRVAHDVRTLPLDAPGGAS